MPSGVHGAGSSPTRVATCCRAAAADSPRAGPVRRRRLPSRSLTTITLALRSGSETVKASRVPSGDHFGSEIVRIVQRF